MRMSHCHQEQEETSTHHPSLSPSAVACAALQGTLCHSVDFWKGLDKNLHKVDPIDFWYTMRSSSNVKWIIFG